MLGLGECQPKVLEDSTPLVVGLVGVRVAAKLHIKETVGEIGQVLLNGVCVYILNDDNLAADTCGVAQDLDRIWRVMKDSEE